DRAREDATIAGERIGAAEATAAEHRERVRVQQELLMERKVALAGAREKLAAARGTLQRLTRSEAELGERAPRLQSELEAGAREFGETAATLVTHKERLQAALDASRAAQEALAEARTVFDAFRTDLGEREAGLKDLRTRFDEARAALTQHEMG